MYRSILKSRADEEFLPGLSLLPLIITRVLYCMLKMYLISLLYIRGTVNFGPGHLVPGLCTLLYKIVLLHVTCAAVTEFVCQAKSIVPSKPCQENEI